MKDVTLHHRYKALLEAMEETIRQQGKFVEAIAADDDDQREVELIQLIAVCASWVGDIRRKRDQPQPSSDPA